MINCLIVDDEPIACEILERHLTRIDNVRVIASCRNAAEAFNRISTEEIDLIFLDINMPEISGLSFARSINKNIRVIFTTAYREYAIDGFDLQAVDYLLKPISFERLLQAISKYMEENPAGRTQFEEELVPEKADFFFVRSDRKMIRINFSDIIFIESLSDYVKIHLQDKTILTRETTGNIESRLPPKDFIRVHRSFIVSVRYINSYTSECIETGGREIPISRSYKDEVLARLGPEM